MSDIFIKILNMSITASWVVLAVLLLRLIFKKAPKWIMCAMWGLVAIRLVCPFSFESRLSIIPSAEPIQSDAIYVEDTDDGLGEESFDVLDGDGLDPSDGTEGGTPEGYDKTPPLDTSDTGIGFESANASVKDSESTGESINTGDSYPSDDTEDGTVGTVEHGTSASGGAFAPITTNTPAPPEGGEGTNPDKSEPPSEPVSDVVNDPEPSAPTAPSDEPSPAPATEKKIDAAKILAAVWALGVVSMLAYTVVSYVRVRKAVSASICVAEDVWSSDDISTPFILGIIKPRIYLPSSLKFRDAQYVTAHERAHLCRLDHIWKPLGFLILAVYWFNPVLWIAYILLCRDIELACDEKVLAELGVKAKKPYSEALINCSVPRRMITACPLAFGELGVKERVKSVLNYKKPAFWIVALAVLATVVTAVCLLTNPITGGGDDADTENTSDVSDTSDTSDPNGGEEKKLIYSSENISVVYASFDIYKSDNSRKSLVFTVRNDSDKAIRCYASDFSINGVYVGSRTVSITESSSGWVIAPGRAKTYTVVLNGENTYREYASEKQLGLDKISSVGFTLKALESETSETLESAKISVTNPDVAAESTDTSGEVIYESDVARIIAKRFYDDVAALVENTGPRLVLFIENKTDEELNTVGIAEGKATVNGRERSVAIPEVKIEPNGVAMTYVRLDNIDSYQDVKTFSFNVDLLDGDGKTAESAYVSLRRTQGELFAYNFPAFDKTATVTAGVVADSEWFTTTLTGLEYTETAAELTFDIVSKKNVIEYGTFCIHSVNGYNVNEFASLNSEGYTLEYKFESSDGLRTTVVLSLPYTALFEYGIMTIADIELEYSYRYYVDDPAYTEGYITATSGVFSVTTSAADTYEYEKNVLAEAMKDENIVPSIAYDVFSIYDGIIYEDENIRINSAVMLDTNGAVTSYGFDYGIIFDIENKTDEELIYETMSCSFNNVKLYGISHSINVEPGRSLVLFYVDPDEVEIYSLENPASVKLTLGEFVSESDDYDTFSVSLENPDGNKVNPADGREVIYDKDGIRFILMKVEHIISEYDASYRGTTIYVAVENNSGDTIELLDNQSKHCIVNGNITTCAAFVKSIPNGSFATMHIDLWLSRIEELGIESGDDIKTLEASIPFVSTDGEKTYNTVVYYEVEAPVTSGTLATELPEIEGVTYADGIVTVSASGEDFARENDRIGAVFSALAEKGEVINAICIGDAKINLTPYFVSGKLTNFIIESVEVHGYSFVPQCEALLIRLSQENSPYWKYDYLHDPISMFWANDIFVFSVPYCNLTYLFTKDGYAVTEIRAETDDFVSGMAMTYQRLFYLDGGKLCYEYRPSKFDYAEESCYFIEYCVARDEFSKELGTVSVNDGYIHYTMTERYTVEECVDLEAAFETFLKEYYYDDYAEVENDPTLDEIFERNHYVGASQVPSAVGPKIISATVNS